MRAKGILIPSIWISGPDPVDHKLYTDCQRARAQAWYRGEEWTITEREYIDMWKKDDNYLKKGRSNQSLCLVRKDYDGPWSLENTEIMSRYDHYQLCSREKIGRYTNKARKKELREKRSARSKL